MLRRLLVVAVVSLCGIPSSSAQPPTDPATPQAPLESPPPPPEAVGDEHSPSLHSALQQPDTAMALGEARGAVRMAPEDASSRLALARALSRIGDLDAAMEECRVAIKLKPDDAKAHLQLGTIL